jgi:hypothetical protein
MYLNKHELTDEDFRELGISAQNVIKGIYIDDTLDRNAVCYGFHFFRGQARLIHIVWDL